MRPLTLLGSYGLALAFFITSFACQAASAHNIAVFGDSLADGVWSGLYQEIKSHPGDKLFRDSKVGTGLTKPDFEAFLESFSGTLEQDGVTDVVVMFGANDEESLRDENHKGYLFEGPGWVRVYDARVQAIVTLCLKHHARVIWLGLPVLRDAVRNQGALFLNSNLQDATTKAGALFVPLEEDFKGPDGAFASHLPDTSGKMHEVRGPDGTHFTFYGYDLIARKVYETLSLTEAAPPTRAAH